MLSATNIYYILIIYSRTNSWALLNVIKPLNGNRTGLLVRAVSYPKAKGFKSSRLGLPLLLGLEVGIEAKILTNAYINYKE